MGLLPDTKSGKIAFINARIAPWTENSVAIGTTTTAITDLTAKLATATTKLDAQIAAQAVAKTATAAADEAINILVAATMDIVKQIRVKASTTGNSVYELAQIPAPATPTPMGPLGMPTGFKAEVELASGALNLSWKNANPRGATGATYQIWRRIGATGPFEYLIGTGGKKYTDGSIPAGSAQVQYKIQAVRSTSVGPVAQFIVNFGAGGSTSVTETSPVKLAA